MTLRRLGVGHPPSYSAVVVLPILVVLSSVLAYHLFFRPISSVGATKTATVSDLIPLFGTIWGFVVVVLQDQVGRATTADIAILLSGVVLAVGPRLAPHVPHRSIPP